MQNTDEIFEIDLTSCEDSGALVDNVVLGLESLEKNAGVSVALKLNKTQINQSQLIFIKSMVESYGHKLSLIDSDNEETKKVCFELGIQTALEHGNLVPEEFNINGIKPINTAEENKEISQGAFVGKKHGILVFDLNGSSNINPDEKTENNDNHEEETETNSESGVKKQTIGVYRKADEEENAAIHENEDVDFYATPTDEPVVWDAKKTIYVTQTLRSGQILDYDGNVVIIGDCHPGSEIKAAGDITVWGVLGSIAHAGVKGNREAKIRALKMHAVQLRIADCYSRRPDGGNIPYVIKSSECTPEEARIVDDNIVLFKMAQN